MSDSFLTQRVYDAAGRLYTALCASPRPEDNALADAIEDRYNASHDDDASNVAIGGTLVARLRHSLDTPQPHDYPDMTVQR